MEHYVDPLKVHYQAVVVYLLYVKGEAVIQAVVDDMVQVDEDSGEEGERGITEGFKVCDRYGAYYSGCDNMGDGLHIYR